MEKWEDTSIIFAQDSVQEGLGGSLYDYLVGGTGVYPTIAVLDSEGRIRHTANNGFGTADLMYDMVCENVSGALVGQLSRHNITLKELYPNWEKSYDLAALEKPTVLNFWFTSCAPCVEEMPEINAFHESYAGAIDTIAVHQHIEGLYTDKTVVDFVNKTEDVHKKLWKDYSISFAKDGEVDSEGRTLYLYLNGKTAWPMTVVLDMNGWVIYRKDGKMVESDFAEMKAALDKALAR